MSQPYVLILYYSRTQGTANVALRMARGVDQVEGIEPRLRTVPPVSAVSERTAPSVPDDGAVFCSKEDLIGCSGLALGSATRFGNMAAPLKYFLDTTADLWADHHLVGKPASVFCSTGSLHGGQESTLLTMMVPLLHHGMLIQGLPYSLPELNKTQSGGTPYGATHVQGHTDDAKLTEHEANLAVSAGKQLAELSLRLHHTR
jgi:NAD(P)H dehydrogenase (quinone)